MWMKKNFTAAFEMLQAVKPANRKRTTKISATTAPPDKICQPKKIA